MLPALCRLVLSAVVLMAMLAATSPPVGAAPSPTDAAAVRAELKRVYDWAGFQRDLPGDDAVAEPPRPTPRDGFVVDLGELPNIVLIGLAIVALAIVAMWLRSGGWNLPAPGEVPAAAEETPADARRQTLKARLDVADRSAQAGDWASAIHVLLLTSIELLRRRVGQDVPVAMTARELVGRAQVEEKARGDFAALVSAAELCHFGGRPADRALYDSCRMHYERLWGMPPEAPA
jgi:hypothetical protein